MSAEPTTRETLMDPQQVTLQVVMVDDEEALCLGVRRIIQKYKVHVADVLVDADYEFRYFTSGEDYLAWLDDGGEVDLLLLDLKLPGVGGMDVLDAMSAKGREVLTIMITAYATFETAVKATKLGAYDFLAKPFTPGGAPLRAAQGDEPAHPEQAGAQAGRGEARDPLQLHLGARARAQGAAQRRRGLPQHPAHHRGRPEPADGRAQHRARRRHEEAHHGPARPDAHRVRPARARRQAAGPARAGQGVDRALRRRRRAPGHHA